MPHAARSLVVLSVLALGLGMAAPGCIGQRRPASERTEPTVGTARLVKPQDVDGSFDAMIEGERMLAVYDEQDPARGAALPLVTIVEYSDFQCPYCTRLAEALDDVARDYARDVKIVFKQFPLPFHGQAEPAARAALAAHQQGKFWDMHDRLFAGQQALGDAQLESHARALGLDVERWRKDFVSDALREHVAAEMASGSALGVRGTPSFFINGKFYSGAMSTDQLRGLIDEELLVARRLLAAGVKRDELYARLLHPAAAKAQPTPPPADAETPKADAPAPAADVAPTPAPTPSPTPILQPNVAIPTGDDRPARGPADALVTIIEFGAFDCEQCRAAKTKLEQVQAKHPDVRVVFRAFAESGPSRRAAHIAYAAHKQGKFWEAHDALMASTELEFTADSATALAERLGLDVERFNQDLRDRSDLGVAKLIRDDRQVVDEFRDPQATAPLYFVNGRVLPGDATVEQIEALVIEERNKATAFAERNPSIARAEIYERMRRTWQGSPRTAQQAP